MNKKRKWKLNKGAKMVGSGLLAVLMLVSIISMSAPSLKEQGFAMTTEQSEEAELLSTSEPVDAAEEETQNEAQDAAEGAESEKSKNMENSGTANGESEDTKDAEAQDAEQSEENSESSEDAENERSIPEEQGATDGSDLMAQGDQILTAQSDDFTVTVNYNETANLPEGATLSVREITEQSNKYSGYAEQAALAVAEQDEGTEASDVTCLHVLDISILDKDEQEVEPKSAVQVKIGYNKGLEIGEDQQIQMVHLANDGTEVLTPEVMTSENEEKSEIPDGQSQVDEIVFETESFSTYVTTATATPSSNTVYNAFISGDVVRQYMIYKEFDNKYYALTSEGKFIEVPYDSSTGKFDLSNLDYMDFNWTVANNNGRRSIYSRDSRKYIHPTSSKWYSIDYNIDNDYATITQVNSNSNSVRISCSDNGTTRYLSASSSSGTVTSTTNGNDNSSIFYIAEIDIPKNGTQSAAGSVSTITKPAEISTTVDTRNLFRINLFDYGPDYTNNNQNGLDRQAYGNAYTGGINSGTNSSDDNNLQFYAYGTAPSDGGKYGINHYTGGDRGVQGVVQSQLGEDGYPVLTTNATKNNGSLSYLFSTEAATGKTVYENVTKLFQQNRDGFYFFNSEQNYARLNTTSKEFTLYSSTYDNRENASAYNKGSVGFFPFDDYNPQKIEVNGTKDTYYDHHFGLTMTSNFKVPDSENKQLNNGKDMVFHFSGDDDMWVFIDDQLVLDIGGVHGPVQGTINFTTGEVYVSGTVKVGDNKIAWDPEDPHPQNTTNTVIQNWVPGTIHTMKIFYLERGGVYSNLKIETNIEPIRVANLEIKKRDYFDKETGAQDESAQSKVIGAKFRLLQAEQVGGEWVAKNPQTGDFAATDDKPAGIFTLSEAPDGIAVFDRLPVGDYLLEEIEAPPGYAKPVYQGDDREWHEEKWHIQVIYNAGTTGATEHMEVKFYPISGGNGAVDKSDNYDMFGVYTYTIEPIYNTKKDITVKKKWLNDQNEEVEGPKGVSVQLRRKKWQEASGGSHNVNVKLYRTKQSNGQLTTDNTTGYNETVTGNTITIEWKDNHGATTDSNVSFDFEVKVGSYQIVTNDSTYHDDKVTFSSPDQNSRKLEIRNVNADVEFNAKYKKHTDQHYNQLGVTSVIGSNSATTSTNYVDDVTFNSATDPTDPTAPHRNVVLNTGNNFTYSWKTGGRESEYPAIRSLFPNYQFPQKDNNGKDYLYYIVELDENGNVLKEHEADGSQLISIEYEDGSGREDLEGIIGGNITVNNRVPFVPPNLRIAKVDESGPVDGIEFTLTMGETTIGKATTANGGYAAFNGLQSGTYILTESPSATYETAGPWTFTVTPSGKITYNDTELETEAVTVGETTTTYFKYSITNTKRKHVKVEKTWLDATGNPMTVKPDATVTGMVQQYEKNNYTTVHFRTTDNQPVFSDVKLTKEGSLQFKASGYSSSNGPSIHEGVGALSVSGGTWTLSGVTEDEVTVTAAPGQEDGIWSVELLPSAQTKSFTLNNQNWTADWTILISPTNAEIALMGQNPYFTETSGTEYEYMVVDSIQETVNNQTLHGFVCTVTQQPTLSGGNLVATIQNKKIPNLKIRKKGKSYVNGVEQFEYLQGAGFTLKDESGTAVVKAEQLTDADGYATFTELDAGTYTLVETTVPPGYAAAGPWTVTVGTDGTITVTDMTTPALTADGDTYCYEYELLNIASYELPSAGGGGTYMFTIGGVAILFTALLLWIKPERKEEQI